MSANDSDGAVLPQRTVALNNGQHTLSIPQPDGHGVENDSNQNVNEEDGSNDSDTSDDEPVESLIQGRQRRNNQANRYASLIQQETIEDEGDDELNEIFQEGGDEDIDFEDSDAADASQAEEDDDSSSSDDDDKGPAAGTGDLEGESELRKEERNAKRVEKRKAERAFTKIPTVRKRVKIDESATPESTQAAAPAERKRKMSERISWLPTDPPARTSSRTLSVQNKQRTIASMKESEKKRLKQLAIMEAAQKRKEEDKAPPMTQADRLAEAARTEELNSKSLNKWEEMEQEKARKQAARLEAMHNRKIDGPFVRWYSAKAEWVNGKLKSFGKSSVTELVRMHHEDDETAEPKKKPGRKPKASLINKADTKEQTAGQESKTPPPTNELSSVAIPTHENALDDFKKGLLSHDMDTEDSFTLHHQREEYTARDDQASQSNDNASNAVEEPMQIDTEAPTVSDRAKLDEDKEKSSSKEPEPSELEDSQLPAGTSAEPLAMEQDLETTAIDTQPNDPSEATVDEANATASSAPLPGTLPEKIERPTVTEHTTRNVITLENYDEASINDPMIRRTVLFNTPLPLNFVPSTFVSKRSMHPTKPAQSVCVITKQPAKYRDPVTGLPYASLSAYKAIQKVVAGNAVWSDLIGAWAGGNDKAPDGGAAAGVPEGFFSGVLPESNENAPNPGDAPVKMEL